MKKKLLIFCFLGVLGILGLFGLLGLLGRSKSGSLLNPLGTIQSSIKPLEKYSFPNLKQRGGKLGQITIDKLVSENDTFSSHIFSYFSDNLKITGLMNLPKKHLPASANSYAMRAETFAGGGKLPVIVLLRGFVDQSVYEPGAGTKRAAEFYSQNGFITLAPDYLGYGGSDKPPDNVWEERFLRVPTVLDLLASVKSLPQAEADKVFIWGHSNGGLTALSVLAVTGKNYPTVLWAPVSKFFPYDVLYYTDEFDDRGKTLRKSLADFEKDYDINLYSYDEYLDWIKTSFIVHQGIEDKEVPVSWTDTLVENLKKKENKVQYDTYPGADHNLNGAWGTVVQRDLNFFKSFL